MESFNDELFRHEELGNHFGIESLFVKDESKNPYGTIKDRKSGYVVALAKEKGVDRLGILTYGNEGYSLSCFAEEEGIDVTCIVPSTLDARIEEELSKHATVVKRNLDREYLGREKREELVRQGNEEVWDVTNLPPVFYENLAELVLSVEPDYIVLPVGSGTIFLGLYNGIKKTNSKAKLIGVTVAGENPIEREFEKRNGKIYINDNPFLTGFTRTTIADKLATPYSEWTNQIVNILMNEGYYLVGATSKEIEEAYRLSRQYGLTMEPSAATALVGLERFDFNKSDRVVLLNTGMGMF